MPTIRFTGVPESRTGLMRQVVDLIADGKRRRVIDEERLKALLGDLYGSKFISSKEEVASWLKKRQANPKLQIPWHFGSWVDALLNSAIDLQELRFSDPSSGELTFEQHAWPSGGIEAAEHIVEVFGGRVLENDAI